ncbi:hypothetical protein LCGC14_1272130 [marine sediment metagenome]|uniref:Uncharacterized protein n=1 Tax=marine sediment metagenome TaxID=412755 RepID=A0A0F9NEE7_9ZZZZ
MIQFIKRKWEEGKIRKQEAQRKSQEKMDFINSKKEYCWREFLKLKKIDFDGLSIQEKIDEKIKITELIRKSINILLCPVCGNDLDIYVSEIWITERHYEIDHTKYYCLGLNCDYCFKERGNGSLIVA